LDWFDYAVPPLAWPDGPAVADGPLGPLIPAAIIEPLFMYILLLLLMIDFYGLFPLPAPNEAKVFCRAAPPKPEVIWVFLVFIRAPRPDLST
jgi:hypothetical protein